MTYIIPNSTVQFFKEFGLSPGYENTLWFASTSAKDQYFDNMTKIATATALSYTRQSRGYIRVEKTMSELLSAGYMRFKNTSHENKWFYAFVKSVEYINEKCTEVTFELDYMMTWMGAFDLKTCFVERMHNPTDAIGDNIIDEGIPCGDVLYGKPLASGQVGSQGWTFCFASTFDPEAESTPVDPEDPENPDPEDPIVVTQGWSGGMYGGLYSGLHYAYANSKSTLNDWINAAVGDSKADGIVGISICPTAFKVNDGDNVKQYEVGPLSKPAIGDPFESACKTGISSYTPKNAKMYTYPYMYFSVTNMEGNWADFRYEMFEKNSNCKFTLQGVSGLQTELVLTPRNYKWNNDDTLLSGEYVASPQEKMTMSDFPLCSYLTDPFMAYLAQNKSSIVAGVVSTAIQGAVGLASGGASALTSASGSGSLTGALTGAIENLGAMMDYARKPNQLNGTQGSSSLFGSLIGADGLKVYKDFWFIPRTITPQYARAIDQFFTMYGYKQNRVITPQMHVRTHWTYIKTVGCNISGKAGEMGMPADHARNIEGIFDNGVRFWVDASEIGNYGLVNSPIN